MTQEQFAKYSYRHSEIMVFHQQHPEADIEMMLLGVDFDNGVFKLIPVDTGYYEEEPVWVNFLHVDKPKRKLKAIICNKQ